MRRRGYLLGSAAVLVSLVVFVVPFAFIVLQAGKDPRGAAELDFSWPDQLRFAQNFVEVVEARDYMLIIAFINSTVLTVGSVTILVILSAMVAFVLQRRRGRWTGPVNFLVLAGLIIPPAVVPTIWVLEGVGLFRTMAGSSSSRSRSDCRSPCCCSATSSRPSHVNSTSPPSSTARGRCACSSR